MRRIIGLVLLIGAFLGGYHLGRQKGSPDVIGYARKAVVAVAKVVGDVADSMADPNSSRTAQGKQAQARVSQSPAGGLGAQASASRGGGQTVAEADPKPHVDWAARIWKSFQSPSKEK